MKRWEKYAQQACDELRMNFELTQKNLHYLRDIAIYYSKAEIKKRENTIRACKKAIKEWSRDYDNLRVGIA